MFIIRKTTTDDLDVVCAIYAGAREYMREHGNPGQWKDYRPALEDITGDIDAGRSYVCVRDGEIAAVYYYAIENEPTYNKIGGQWLDDEPYGVVHRIARSGSAGKGAAEFCLNRCFEDCGNLRIDTHENNISMRNLLKRLGFTYCGIIWISNGEERLAFQKR